MAIAIDFRFHRLEIPHIEKLANTRTHEEKQIKDLHNFIQSSTTGCETWRFLVFTL